MAPKNYNSLSLRTLTVNIASKKGKKECNENIFKNFYKYQCKISLKSPERSLKALLVLVAPCFYLTSRKVGRKSSISVPAILKPKSRVFHGLKTMIIPEAHNISCYGILSRLNSQVLNFSRETNNDSQKLGSTERAFEHKTFAHFRWFK